MNSERLWGQKTVLRGSLLAVMLLLALALSASATVIDPSRVVAWQGNVGVVGDIPTRTTIYTTLSPSGGDDSSAIQMAINNCPSGQVVKLNAGTFHINSEVDVTRSNITIRGAGMGQTIIKATSPYTGYYLNGIVKFDNGSSWDMSIPSAVGLSSGYTKGSTQIVTSASHGLSAGDVILIDQVNSNTSDLVVTCDGSEGCGIGSQGRGSPLRSQGMLNKVSSVVNSTTINLELPLYFSFDVTRTPQLVKVVGLTQNSGLEDLTVDSRDGTSTTFLNATALSFTGADNCWLLRVEVIHGDSSSTGGWGMLRMYHSYRNTIRSSWFHGARIAGTDSYGILFQPWAGANLFENNVVTDRPFVISGPTSGNVFAYNYIQASPWISGAQLGCIFLHGAHPSFNLFEGNYTIGYITADTNSHGNSSYNTFLRNKSILVSSGPPSFANWVVDLEFLTWYYNFVGNILGTTGFETVYQSNGEATTGNYIYRVGYQGFTGAPAGANPYGGAFDSAVATKLLQHGNWDSVNNGIVWNSGISDHNIPNSYYLSSPPSFFGSCGWPPIGPDLNPMAGTLPAKAWYEGSSICGGGSPPTLLPPANLRIGP